MQRITSIAATAILLVAVTGCSKSEPAAEATASAGASEASAAAWTPALPTAGTFEVTDSDGKAAAKVTISADYAYSRVPSKGATEAGIVKLADGKVCFDPSGKELPTQCYTESVRAADGSFTATDDKGVTVSVKPAAK